MRSSSLRRRRAQSPGVIDFPSGDRQQRRQGEQVRKRRSLRFDPYRLVIAAAVIYFVWTVVGQQMTFLKLQAQEAELTSKVEEVSSQIAVLRQRLEYLQSDEYILQEARSRFGLAHPGEIHYRTLATDAGVTADVMTQDQ